MCSVRHGAPAWRDWLPVGNCRSWAGVHVDEAKVESGTKITQPITDSSHAPSLRHRRGAASKEKVSSPLKVAQTCGPVTNYPEMPHFLLARQCGLVRSGGFGMGHQAQWPIEAERNHKVGSALGVEARGAVLAPSARFSLDFMDSTHTETTRP